MIKVICIGKLKEKSLVSLVDDYLSRILPYTKISIDELKDFPNYDDDSSNRLSIEKESKSILDKILIPLVPSLFWPMLVNTLLMYRQCICLDSGEFIIGIMPLELMLFLHDLLIQYLDSVVEVLPIPFPIFS